MDRSQIINLVINAVITIVTTAVVTRLSLKRGKLDLASTIRSRFNAKFKAYMKAILSLVWTIWLIISDYRYVTEPNAPPVDRLTAYWICIRFVGALAWIGITVSCFTSLFRLLILQRAARRNESASP